MLSKQVRAAKINNGLRPYLTKLSTAIKGSNSTIFKKVKVKLDWGGHTEDREFYMTHLVGGEDIILGEPALTTNNAIIKAGNFPVIIQPPNKEIITLEPWQGEVSTKVVSARTNITINPSSNIDKEPTVIKTLHSLVQDVFDPFKEFPEIFTDKPPTKLPPLRNINHHINLKPGYS